MSGHSKWNNIKHKKEKNDAAKAGIFTKIGKEIAVAVRAGGGDPNNNSKLRELIAKAKANNIPNDNIERAIKKSLEKDGATYEEMTYEGYGPGGVAVIVEAATDSKNRTAADVRHYFSKYGGNLGAMGCVSFMFSEKGVIVIADEDEEYEEDRLMEDALEAGASDFEGDENVYEIYTEPEDVYAISEALTAKGYKIASAERAKVPSTYVTLEKQEDIDDMQNLLDKLEENDDITNVYHNWEE
ncbi:MAG: YebC/PmpR family DNA-binding transcriptional regulator [Clostridia bacterium]|nr:YebC/PmpR family DNA-binding transcriptional regulator [Clostridia bacterium]